MYSEFFPKWNKKQDILSWTNSMDKVFLFVNELNEQGI